jgi:hypothetical protein
MLIFAFLYNVILFRISFLHTIITRIRTFSVLKQPSSNTNKEVNQSLKCKYPFISADNLYFQKLNMCHLQLPTFLFSFFLKLQKYQFRSFLHADFSRSFFVLYSTFSLMYKNSTTVFLKDFPARGKTRLSRYFLFMKQSFSFQRLRLFSDVLDYKR